MTVLAEIVSSILLFGLVLGMSATVEFQQVARQFRNRNALLIGLALQFVLLPLLGFIVVTLFRFSSAVGITLLVVTSSPGGSYSNWWCSLFNAELALSVTMTALSTLLSTVMLPLNLMLYTRLAYRSTDDDDPHQVVQQHLDWSALFISLTVVLGGIVTGLMGGQYAKQRACAEVFHRRANRFGNLAGLALIAVSVYVSSTHPQSALWQQSAAFYFGCAIPPVLGLGLATYAGTRMQLPKPERVAVAVESCYQNTGIATSVALSMFSGPHLAEAIVVPLYYGMVVAIMLAMYCVVAWKMGWTKAPRNENVCKMIYNSYEVDTTTTTADADAHANNNEAAVPQVGIESVFNGSSSHHYDDNDVRSRNRNNSNDRSSENPIKMTRSSDEETADCSFTTDFETITEHDASFACGGGGGGDHHHQEEEEEKMTHWDRAVAIFQARAIGYRYPTPSTRPRTMTTTTHDVEHHHELHDEPKPSTLRRTRVTTGEKNPESQHYHPYPPHPYPHPQQQSSISTPTPTFNSSAHIWHTLDDNDEEVTSNEYTTIALQPQQSLPAVSTITAESEAPDPPLPIQDRTID